MFKVGQKVRVREDVGPEWSGFEGVVMDATELSPGKRSSTDHYVYKVRVTHRPPGGYLDYSLGDVQTWWDSHLEGLDGLLDV